MTAILAKPQWIAKMYPAKPGLDHLGLGSVSSGQILTSLSPSINVLTFHPRYHSFYVFILDEFWRRDRPRSKVAFKDFFRPREFIFSVGAHMCENPEHNQMQHIVGGQVAGPLAGQQKAKYDSSTDYIESELGGYGLYYRTVMAELGLIYPGGKGFPYPVDVPTEYGKEVAEAFRSAVKKTKYYQTYFNLDVCDVPIDVIKEYASKSCLCQLQIIGTPDRPYLLNTFLHRGSKKEAESRRSTFRLFLDIAAQTNDHALDEDHFRRLLYFGKTESGIVYQPSKAQASTFKRWRLYQAREYYAFALNALWSFLCSWGIRRGGDIDPLPISEFYESLKENARFNYLAEKFGLDRPNLSLETGFRTLEEWLLKSAGSDREHFDELCSIDSPIHEHRLYQLANLSQNHSNPEIMVAGMFTMLALLNLRFGRHECWAQPEWEISKMGSDGRLSVDGFLRSLNKRLESGPVTIEEILRWIYDDYVLLQHQLVATNKLPDNTFRFQREGASNLRFFNFYNPLSFMSSRFEAISTTIYELGLCGDLSTPDHALSVDGLRLLENGDL